MNNSQIRERGKENLRGNYLVARLSIFLIAFTNLVLQLIGNRFLVKFRFSFNFLHQITMLKYHLNGWQFIIWILFLIGMLMISFFRIGYRWQFLEIHSGEKMTMGQLIKPFQQNVIKLTGYVIYKKLILFLWSLLFVIPAIVKSYSWMMSDFVYYDQSDLENKSILDESEYLMLGNRWRYFQIDFSYLFFYFLPSIIWIVFNIYLLYVINPSNPVQINTFLFWNILGFLIVFISTSLLILLIQPKRLAARAVFYTELLKIN